MASTFHTSMHEYRFDGRHVLAPATTPELPATLGGKVSGVVLDQGRLAGDPTNPPVTVIPSMPDCSPSYGDVDHATPPAYGESSFPTAICAYRPDQLRYGLGLGPSYSAGVNGAGQT